MFDVSYQDVETSLGHPLADGPERAQVEMWIGDAELQIRLRLGDPALLDEQTVAFVIREAVVARAQNPAGYQYEAVDDYRYGLPNESRKVTILPEWWEMLSPSRFTGAFTIRPGR